MKQLLSIAIAAVLILSIGVISAFAAPKIGGDNFVDADGDGVCDNQTECPRPQGGNPQGGQNFEDADGDGVCDNQTECPRPQGGNPQGGGKQHQQGREESPAETQCTEPSCTEGHYRKQNGKHST